MARRNKAASIVAVVAVLAAWLGAGREARAVITVGSITVGGGVVQNGDPAYTYQIEVLLTGTITPGYTTSFTFGPLVGVDSNSPTSVLMEYMAPGVSWSTPPTITSDYTAPSYPPNPANSALSYNQSSVTWNYTGSSSITSPDGGTMPLLLGIFQVTTDPAYSNYLPTGYPSFLTSGVTFSWLLNGGSPVPGSGSGTLNLQPGGVLAPEPSTAVAPLFVIAMLPVVWLVKQRLRGAAA